MGQKVRLEGKRWQRKTVCIGEKKGGDRRRLRKTDTEDRRVREVQ